MHCFCAFVLCTVHYVGGTYFVFLIEPKCKFLSALLQRNQLLMLETWVGSLGLEDSLEDMATRSSVLAWRIPKDRGAWW